MYPSWDYGGVGSDWCGDLGVLGSEVCCDPPAQNRGRLSRPENESRSVCHVGP